MPEAISEFVKMIIAISICVVFLGFIILIFMASNDIGNTMQRKNTAIAEANDARDLIAYNNRIIMPQDVVNLFAVTNGTLPIQFNGIVISKEYASDIDGDTGSFYTLSNLMHLGKWDVDNDYSFREFATRDFNADNVLNYDKLYFSEIYTRTPDIAGSVDGYIIYQVDIDADNNVEPTFPNSNIWQGD